MSKTFEHKFSRAKEKELIKNPPQPFTTSGLQQSSNNNLHISPKETMSLAQKLYECGYITYMRTDSKVYSQDFVDETKDYITNKYDANYINGTIEKLIQSKDKPLDISNNESEVEKKTKTKSKSRKEEKGKDKEKKQSENPAAQEAHEAIRPTHITVESLPEDEDIYTAKHRKLYKLIWTNTLESLMANAVYNSLMLNISAPQNLIYKYSAEENVFPGWKIVNGLDEEKYYQFLKTLKEGPINYKKIISKQTLKDLKTHYNEAKLVQLLEQRGIGRPSTFSSLIDKIQERNYVNRENVEGKKLTIIDYLLEQGKDDIILEKGEKTFGNEKNKLVITQLGIFVIEFLIKNFDSLFDYDYTKVMEDELDVIAKGNKKYYDLCKECNTFIEDLIKNNSLSLINENGANEKVNIKIDEKHTYLIGRNGPTIKYKKEDGSTGFYGVKKDIDIEKLKTGQYKLEEIIVSTEDNNKVLGEYKGNNLYLKYGKFGYYLECGELRKSLTYTKINVPIKNIGYDDAVNILENSEANTNSLVRRIDETLSIRKGKYGDYIFYKTEKMSKPQFYKLGGFKEDYKTCSITLLKKWINDTYFNK